jgi:FlaA1/EpsC-like NDP-sugar epimerase
VIVKRVAMNHGIIVFVDHFVFGFLLDPSTVCVLLCRSLRCCRQRLITDSHESYYNSCICTRYLCYCCYWIPFISTHLFTHLSLFVNIVNLYHIRSLYHCSLFATLCLFVSTTDTHTPLPLPLLLPFILLFFINYNRIIHQWHLYGSLYLSTIQVPNSSQISTRCLWPSAHFLLLIASSVSFDCAIC